MTRHHHIGQPGVGKSRAVRFAILAGTALALTGCGGGGSDDTSSANPVTIGGTGSTPPPSSTPTPTPSPPATTVSLSLEPEANSVTRPGFFHVAASPGAGVTTVVLYRNGTEIARADGPAFDLKIPYVASASGTDQLSATGFDASGRSIATASLTLDLAIGRVLYVAGSGNDANDGLSETRPKRTLRAIHALTQPGDSVLVMDGTYTESNPNADVLTISRSGTASGWIAYIGYPGQQPFIKARNWQAIKIQADYIIVDGITMEGNRAEVTLEQAQAEASNLNNPITSGNGIGIAPPFDNKTRRVHHVIVRNNEVRDFPGGGIGSQQSDYITIEGNRVYRNGWYAPYGNSGISFYQSWNSDQSTGIKMIIRGNIAYENYNYIPFYFSDPDPAQRKVTDGNGIIIDDSRNTQHDSALGAYLGQTLVENNLVFNNGGRGLSAFSSDHVIFVNNTSWMNATHPNIASETLVGDASDVTFLNTIIVARSDKRVNTVFNASSFAYLFNLISGGTSFNPGAGGNNIFAAPQFVDAARQLFQLAAGSAGIDAGRADGAPARDLARRARPQGAGVDIGAYESF